MHDFKKRIRSGRCPCPPVTMAAWSLCVCAAFLSSCRLTKAVWHRHSIMAGIRYPAEAGQAHMDIHDRIPVIHVYGTPEEMGDALRQLKVPYPLVFILTTAMRFVPLLRQKIDRITAAQASRGIDLRPRFKNLPHLTALLIPLVVQAFILSDDLAVAMESRGFSRKGRSVGRRYRLTFRDYACMVITLAGVALFYIWERGIV